MEGTVVSTAGGARLRIHMGRWVLVTAGKMRPIEEVMYGLLPLLERDPNEVRATLAELEGPSFPYEILLLTALGSDSGYWQEKAVSWLHALDIQPSGPVAEAARRALAKKLASQQHRQRLAAWLAARC